MTVSLLKTDNGCQNAGSESDCDRLPASSCLQTGFRQILELFRVREMLPRSFAGPDGLVTLQAQGGAHVQPDRAVATGLQLSCQETLPRECYPPTGITSSAATCRAQKLLAVILCGEGLTSRLASPTHHWRD